jgi:23S rRNA (cytosine1962-C5)-methyltransferase
MNTLATVFLRPGEADRIVAGHPWIYQGNVLRLTQQPHDGDVVQVKDHRQRFLGIGFFNSKSKITVRVISPERTEINHDFFAGRFRAAWELRRRHLPDATSFRMINAEGDQLSGLVVDKYEDVLVVQTPGLGMDRRKDTILAALKSVWQPRAILERNDTAFRKFEGLPDANGTLWGECEGTMAIKINSLRFKVNLAEGHKTGFYLDQQANYHRVGRFAAGARVLDCFCFQGGFGLHAAHAGATHVHLLDQSVEAIAAAKTNAEANGLAAACSFEAANVFDWLKAQTTRAPHEKLIPKFDLIVLDPPSFTRTRDSLPNALRGYKEIHLRALKLLRPGGVLATFCCSHHVDPTTFESVILAAAFDARKVLRRIERYSQSLDHPVLPSIPETEYLKGSAYEVVR